MSATPPFGPAYGQSPDDAPRQPEPNQRQPQAGPPRAAHGGQTPPGGHRPRAGRPQAGQGPMPAAGGRPQTGAPQAGRPVPPQYPSQRTGPTPPSAPRSYQPRPPSQRQDQAPPPAPAPEERDPEPFEEAAFAAAPQSDWNGEATTTIGRLGAAKESQTRRRSDFQKKRSRARKSSPVPKIIAAVVAVALLGAAGWWWMNRDDSGTDETAADPNLTYSGSEAPCSLVDAAPLAGHTDGVEPETVAAAEQKRRGWEQSCVLTYGAADSAAALVEFQGTVFDSDAKASVNYELGAREVADMTDPWTVIEPAPQVGEQSAAVARVVETGTSNLQFHIQDGNAYLVVRLSLVDSGLDQQGLADLAAQLANSYLDAWKDA